MFSWILTGPGTSVRDPGELHLMKLKMVTLNHQREDTSFSEQQIILMEVCTHHPLLEDSFPTVNSFLWDCQSRGRFSLPPLQTEARHGMWILSSFGKRRDV